MGSLRDPIHLLAFGFGAGLAPFAPGTWGTLLAWPVGWMLGFYADAAILAFIALFFAIGVWACAPPGPGEDGGPVRRMVLHPSGLPVGDRERQRPTQRMR